MKLPVILGVLAAIFLAVAAYFGIEAGSASDKAAKAESELAASQNEADEAKDAGAMAV